MLPYVGRQRVTSARAVASTRHVPLMAFITALLRWPDRDQPLKYVKGFEILGDIRTSSIFRGCRVPSSRIWTATSLANRPGRQFKTSSAQDLRETQSSSSS